MERRIARIEDKRVFIDAPITTALDAKFGAGTLDRFTWSGRIANSGIEDIKGISLFNAAVKDDEEHGWTFVSINRAEDCWARRIVSEDFGYACVTLGDGGRQLSVMASQAMLSPLTTPL